MSGGGNLFHADHPRRLIPELSAVCHKSGWFNGTGSGGFFSIRQGDSVYVAASNVVKNRLEGNDLFVYKVSDSSVTLSPPQEKKLEPCEIIGLIMLIYKERKGTGAVVHSNGQDPVLASLVYTGAGEFKMKDQGAIRGIYNESLKRNYKMEEEVRVPIIHHATEAALRTAIRHNPHANAVIVRNQGMFVWADNWQKAQAMSESYHLLTSIAVQMGKLGLNLYTHNVTSNDVASVNDSINAEVKVTTAAATPPTSSMPSPVPAAKATPQPQQPKSPAKKVTTPAAPKSAPAAAAAASSTPAAAKQPEAKANKKVANGTAAKASPLKKTRGGKVTKVTKARMSVGKSPGGQKQQQQKPNKQQNQQQQQQGFNGPPNMGGPPMMGPGPMGPGPMGGPPMGGPMVGPGGPMMGPGMMMPMGPGPMMMGPGGPGGPGAGPGNFNQNKRNSAGGRGGRGGRGGARGGRGGGGRGGGQGAGKKNNAGAGNKANKNKSGVAKDVLMNY